MEFDLHELAMKLVLFYIYSKFAIILLIEYHIVCLLPRISIFHLFVKFSTCLLKENFPTRRLEFGSVLIRYLFLFED